MPDVVDSEARPMRRTTEPGGGEACVEGNGSAAAGMVFDAEVLRRGAGRDCDWECGV